jgi:hypothetical protein
MLAILQGQIDIDDFIDIDEFPEVQGELRGFAV